MTEVDGCETGSERRIRSCFFKIVEVVRGVVESIVQL